MDSTEGVPSSGVYSLVIRARGGSCTAGAWGRLDLREGYYAYVGRAKRGLPARLARHARRGGKRMRWHIDYLLEVAELEEAWIFLIQAGECAVALRLERGGASREGLESFGASDCRCCGHLLFLGRLKPSPPAEVTHVIESL